VPSFTTVFRQFPIATGQLKQIESGLSQVHRYIRAVTELIVCGFNPANPVTII